MKIFLYGISISIDIWKNENFIYILYNTYYIIYISYILYICVCKIFSETVKRQIKHFILGIVERINLQKERICGAVVQWCRFPPWHVGKWRWWGFLTMVPSGNTDASCSEVNHLIIKEFVIRQKRKQFFEYLQLYLIDLTLQNSIK